MVCRRVWAEALGDFFREAVRALVIGVVINVQPLRALSDI